jgi:outer membrane protein assembly factor BamB
MVDFGGDGVDEVIGASGVYLSRSNEISAVNSKTGELVWKKSLENYISRVLTAKTREKGTRVFYATAKTYVLLDDRGSVVWEQPWKETVYRFDGFSVSDGLIFASTYSVSGVSRVYAIQTDGSIRWTYELPARAWIVAVNDLNNDGEPDVVLNPYYEPVCALNGKTGELLWKFGLGSPRQSVSITMGDSRDTLVLLFSNDPSSNMYDKVVWPKSGKVLNEVRAKVADVNSDKIKEVVVASSQPDIGWTIRLLDYQGLELWKQPTSSDYFELLDPDSNGKSEILMLKSETHTLVDFQGNQIATYKKE